jgi:phage-related minor tail protein
MPDIATLGLEVNSSQIVEGKNALDQFAESSVKVEQAVRSTNGQMNDTAKIMKSQADAAKAAEDANNKFLASLEREIAVFGMGRGELERYKAAELGLGSAAQSKAMALGMSIDALHREEAEMRALSAAQDKAAASGDAFIKKLQDQVATLGMSAQQLQAYRAAQLGVSDAAAPLIAKLGEAGAGAHGAGKHLEGLSLSTVAAKRELLVLAHELSQGNYSKFGGSMMVLGEQTGAAGLLFSSTGIAALAFAGVLAAVGYALIKGASDQKHMNDALVMTGNYAGVTSDKLNDLAHAAVEAGGSLGEAKKVATELAGSGKFTGDQIGYITEATVAWEHATGMSVKAIIKDFESLAVQSTSTGTRATEAISRAALKLDDQYHFLTEAVYEQIRALEKEGDAKAASALATETFAKVTHDRAEEILANLGSIARGWNTIKEVIGQAGDAVGKFGARATPATEVAKQSTRLRMFDEGLASSNERLGRPADAMSADLAAARNRIVLQLTEAVTKLNEADAAAIAQGKNAATQSAGAHAASMLAASDAKHLKETKLELALASNKEYEAAIRAANPDSALITEKAIEERRLKTIKDNTDKAPKAKVDQVESTELADRLARIQDLVNADKEMYGTMSKMEDMFHAAGKMGDEEYYQLQRDHIVAVGQDQAYGYTKQIAELKAYNNATAAEAAKHAKQINDIDEKRKAADAKMQDELSLLDAKEFLRKEAVEAASDQALNTYLSGLDQEAKKLELSNQAHETSKGAIERESIARLDAAIAQQQQLVAGQNSDTATEKEIAQGTRLLKFLEDERAARARIAAGLDQQQAIQYKDKAADQAIKDWQRAGQSISESLTSAFGEGGKALGSMFQAYAKGMEGQLRAQKELAAAKKLAEDNPDKIAAINRAQLSGAQSQIQGYAGMTAAAQGFFTEGSRGYQAMHAATVALQGAEVALSLIKGVNAVLTQGEGDPYSAFVRMAAMAAIVTGLGVAISGGGGGGGGQSAADVQKAQGTGSVFGDSSAKSDSVRRSIEQLTANSSDMLPINQGMLTALQNIESSMTGLTNLVVRTTGLTDGANMGIQTGTIATGGAVALAGSAQVGSMIGGALAGPLGVWIGGAIGGAVSKLWGKTTQNIVDSGLQYGGSVRSLQAGQGFDQYASIDTTKSSFFGLSKSTSNRVEVQGLNDELSKQFGLIFTNLDKSLQAAATAMGGSAADVTKVLDNLTLESSKVSLKGLTGTALTDALNSVISKSMDEIAEAAFPQLDQFRTVGEGYAETVMRLAGDYAKLDSILAASSTTFGATGMASIAAREHLIELAGGIDQLATQTNSFTQNFLSTAEQLAPVQKYVTDQLAAMGLQSLDTRDKFKDYVLGLANSGALATETGAQQYTALLALADAFAKTHAATVDLTKSEQEITDERTDLQNKLDELTMTQAQLADKARAAIDGHNQALYDQVTAAQAAKDAADALANTNKGYQDQIDALLKSTMSATQVRALETAGMDASTLALYDRLAGLHASIDAEKAASDAIKAAQASSATAMNSFGDALAGSMKAATEAAAAFRALNDALLIGDSSALNPEQKYLEAKRQFDTADGSNLEAAEKAFLDASKSWFGGSAGYAADFAAVIAKNSQFADASDAQAAAIPAFWAAIKNQMMGIDGSHANGLDFVPFNGYRAELHYGERVQTAAAVRSGDAAAERTNTLLEEVLTELRADKSQRGAVGTETIAKLDRLADKMDAQKRTTRAKETA